MIKAGDIIEVLNLPVYNNEKLVVGHRYVVKYPIDKEGDLVVVIAPQCQSGEAVLKNGMYCLYRSVTKPTICSDWSPYKVEIIGDKMKFTPTPPQAPASTE